MVSLDALVMYTLTTALVCFIPGPAAMVVTSSAISLGKKHAAAAIAGICLANVLFFTLSGLGLLSIVGQSPQILQFMRWLGIAYLSFIGLSLMFASEKKALSLGATSSRSEKAYSSTCAKALSIQALNPKSILYFAALLPQFINPQEAMLPQLAIYCAITLLFDILAYSFYAAVGIGFGRASTSFSLPLLKRFTGLIFLVSSVRLASN